MKKHADVFDLYFACTLTCSFNCTVNLIDVLEEKFVFFVTFVCLLLFFKGV